MLPDTATQNVIQLGFAFFINFLAFNTQGFIEEAVIDSASQDGSINKHAGYYSLAIIYAFYTIGNLFAAPLVSILSPKWAMVLGTLFYAVFQVGFLFLNETYLYISSAILGIGASVLWTGQGVYLSQNCTKETTSRNSALLWGMHESCLIVGGIFLFIIFNVTESHGHISGFTIKLLYSIFFVLSILAAIVFAVLRKPAYEENTQKSDEHWKTMLSTFKLILTKRMILLAFVFSYTGIEQAFWTGIYPTAISFTKKLGYSTNSLLALNLIATGVGQVTCGVLFGILGHRTKKVGRDFIILFGTIIHLIAYLLCFINYPHDASLHQTSLSGALIEPNLSISLFIGILLGFADACWNTQIMSLLCDVYNEKSSQAFAIFKFYESLLSCFTFFYSSVISFYQLLLLLIIFAILASACFFIVERILPPRRKDTVADIEEKSRC